MHRALWATPLASFCWYGLSKFQALRNSPASLWSCSALSPTIVASSFTSVLDRKLNPRGFPFKYAWTRKVCGDISKRKSLHSPPASPLHHRPEVCCSDMLEAGAAVAFTWPSNSTTCYAPIILYIGPLQVGHVKNSGKIYLYSLWGTYYRQGTSCKAVTSLKRCLNWLHRCSSAATALAVSTTLQRPLALQGDPAASNSRTSTAYRKQTHVEKELDFNACCWSIQRLLLNSLRYLNNLWGVEILILASISTPYLHCRHPTCCCPCRCRRSSAWQSQDASGGSSTKMATDAADKSMPTAFSHFSQIFIGPDWYQHHLMQSSQKIRGGLDKKLSKIILNPAMQCIPVEQNA